MRDSVGVNTRREGSHGLMEQEFEIGADWTLFEFDDLLRAQVSGNGLERDTEDWKVQT